MLVIKIFTIIPLLRFATKFTKHITEISTVGNTPGKAAGTGEMWFCLWLKCRFV